MSSIFAPPIYGLLCMGLFSTFWGRERETTTRRPRLLHHADLAEIFQHARMDQLRPQCGGHRVCRRGLAGLRQLCAERGLGAVQRARQMGSDAPARAPPPASGRGRREGVGPRRPTPNAPTAAFRSNLAASSDDNRKHLAVSRSRGSRPLAGVDVAPDPAGQDHGAMGLVARASRSNWRRPPCNANSAR